MTYFLGFRYLVNNTIPLGWCLYTLVAAVLGLGCVANSSKLAFHCLHLNKLSVTVLKSVKKHGCQLVAGREMKYDLPPSCPIIIAGR